MPIPEEIKDAALVDDAGYFRQLFQITIPMTLPVMMVAVLFGIVFSATDIIIILVGSNRLIAFDRILQATALPVSRALTTLLPIKGVG
jgi:ABC-type sugar transport system permease subunit